MSWVRYDDGFDSHHKIGALLAQGSKGLEAVGLHVLANTWSARTKQPGFVPAHQPGVIIANPRRGQTLAKMLEAAGLWDEVDGGWMFHDHHVYRSSSGRQTAGTPVELSSKRADAGRRGGAASAARRQANGAANEANDSSKSSNTSSNGCSPVVSTTEPNGSSVLTPVPIPTSSDNLPVVAVDDDAVTGISEVVKSYVDGATKAGLPRPSERLRGKVGRDAKRLASRENIPIPALIAAARSMGERGWDDIDRELQRVGANKPQKASSWMT